MLLAYSIQAKLTIFNKALHCQRKRNRKCKEKRLAERVCNIYIYIFMYKFSDVSHS